MNKAIVGFGRSRSDCIRHDDARRLNNVAAPCSDRQIPPLADDVYYPNLLNVQFSTRSGATMGIALAFQRCGSSAQARSRSLKQKYPKVNRLRSIVGLDAAIVMTDADLLAIKACLRGAPRSTDSAAPRSRHSSPTAASLAIH